MNRYVALGALLQKAREDKHLSKARLGSLIGKTGPAIGMFEAGGKRPSAETMANLIENLELEGTTKQRAIELFEEASGQSLPQISTQPKTPLPERKRQAKLASYGLSPIVDFLESPANDPLIRTIMKLRQEGHLSRGALWNAVAMAQIVGVTLTEPLWEEVLTCETPTE